ncbi:TetR/AcrR family transcriptional regulator [Streptomyces sp. LMG1-1-1.1]|uniref:TetR/AcrR family transcriptional regulator n=1 Tax=Streptomyces sp. LMG1-1-1.1 TaxID=3135245 RepID=UPI003465295C
MASLQHAGEQLVGEVDERDDVHHQLLVSWSRTPDTSSKRPHVPTPALLTRRPTCKPLAARSSAVRPAASGRARSCTSTWAWTPLGGARARRAPGASTEQIAAAARVSRTTIHRRFTHRQALVEALATSAARQLAQAVDDGRPDIAPPLVAMQRLTANVLQLKDAWAWDCRRTREARSPPSSRTSPAAASPY